MNKSNVREVSWLNQEIARLDKEWERLDGQGGMEQDQQEIIRQIEALTLERDMALKLDVERTITEQDEKKN